MSLTRLANELDPILERAIRATGAAIGNIQILDPAVHGLRILVQRGFEPPFLDYFRVVRAHTAACGAALETRRRTVVGDVTISSLFTPRARRVMLAAGARSCQSTPIAIDGEVVGVISTHFHEAHLPAPRELARIDALVREAAAIIGSLGLVNDSDVEARTIRDELHEMSDKTRIIRRRRAR